MPDAQSLPTVHVRPATADDVPAIGQLGAELVRSHHEFDRKRFMEPTPHTAEGYASFLGSQLSAKDVVLLVADDGGQVIGYTYSGVEGVDWMSLRGPAGVLHDIVVHPSHRGRGVGQQLLDATLRALEARGVRQFVLHTAAPNQTAKRLFARAGFRETMVEMTRDVAR